ncbi:hypothetical protein HQ590_08735 [bacterium]|nr:hypothetical protein [bacterium]
MNYGAFLVSALVLLVLVHLDPGGGYLPAVLLVIAAGHGAVLVVAATELSNGHWLGPLKKHLLALAPLQLLFPLLTRLAPYPWRADPTAWLSDRFFLARGAGLLLVTALVALVYRRASLAESPRARSWAVIYILAFVVTETVVAVDWVMSFDYPWISTMFPALYMVESFIAGLVVAGVLCFVLHRRGLAGLTAPVYDTATLLFGFALFWGGLFFAQYLTIWYGNLPEEVAYFTGRFAHGEGAPLFTVTVLLLFAVPFFVLLIHRARTCVTVLFVLANLTAVGLFLHRWFHVFPHADPHPALLVGQVVAAVGVVGGALRISLRDPAG